MPVGNLLNAGNTRRAEPKTDLRQLAPAKAERMRHQLSEDARAKRMYGSLEQMSRKLSVDEQAARDLEQRRQTARMNAAKAKGSAKEQAQLSSFYGKTTPEAEKRPAPKSWRIPDIG